MKLSPHIVRLCLTLIAPLALLFASVSFVASGLKSFAAEPTFSGLQVSSNELVNTGGQQVVLHGADRGDAAYSCVQGKGIFDSPADQTSVNVMKTWNINAVRLPLNEDCWLNINGVPSQWAGTNYQQAIVTYVNLLNQNGIYAIVDLHWNAPGTTMATGQQQMADEDHSPAFWSSVATTFKGNNAVLFDLYNEPEGISWSCWKNGGSCGSFPIAGMQQLVNTVRATGATNVVMLGGSAWSNDLSGWLANEPTDTLNPPQIAASWHVYNFNSCANTTCYSQIIAPVAARVPIVAGEMGENDCTDGFINSLMPWLDQQNISYLAWSWNVSSCSSPSLITDDSGTPSNFGVGFKSHLLSFSTSQPSPTPTSPGATDTPVPTTVPTTVPANTPVPTAAPANTPVPTAIPANTPVPTAVPANTPVPTAVPANMPVPTAVPANTPVPTAVPANTPVPTAVPANTPVPTAVPANMPVPTAVPANTPVPTAVPASIPISQHPSTPTPIFLPPDPAVTHTPVPLPPNSWQCVGRRHRRYGIPCWYQ